MYFLDGFVDGNLVESAHHFLDLGCHNGFFVGFACGIVLFGWLCPSGGHVPWPSSTAVYFRFLFDVFCITAFYEAGSSLMPSVWLSAGVVAFAVG